MKAEVEVVKRSSPVALIILLLALIFSSLSLNVPPASAHKSEGYLYAADINPKRPDWMSAVPNSTNIYELSIPGTHQSLSFAPTLAPGVREIVQCQSLPLIKQLEGGIRALDIRVRMVDDSFKVWHGSVDDWGEDITDQRIWFADVLPICETFLTQHPDETIFMRLTHEYLGGTHPKNCSLTFINIFRKYVFDYPDLFWLPSKLAWRQVADAPPDFALPTLGELRGKIVILENDAHNYRIWDTYWVGLHYDEQFFPDRQDDYEFPHNWHLYDKWELVKKYLMSEFPIENKTRVNCLVGSGGSYPYFVASGHSSKGTSDPRLWTGYTDPPTKHWEDFPRINFLGLWSWIDFEGINELTLNYLKSHKLDGVGMIFADFPGPGLIEYIIRLNPMPKRDVKMFDPLSTLESLEVEPGRTVSYTLNVTNVGEDEDTFNLGLTGIDSAWYTFSPQPVTLAANASQNITLSVTPARNWTTAPGDYSFVVTIQSVNDPKAIAQVRGKITAKPFHEPKLFVMPDSFEAQPGDAVTYTIGVQNLGNVRDDYNVSAKFLNPGGLSMDPRWTTLWPYKFWRLDPGDTGTGYLQISVPEDWAANGLEEATYTFTIFTVCQANSTANDEVARTLDVTVDPRTLSITLSGEFDYTFKEPVTIKFSALVKDLKSRLPISNANVSIEIFAPNGDLLWADSMAEMPNGNGVYIWESEETIQDIMKGPHWQPFKGVYAVCVEASYNAGPISYETLEFHIDPPAESASNPWVCYLVAAMGAALVGLLVIQKIRKKKTRII